MDGSDITRENYDGPRGAIREQRDYMRVTRDEAPETAVTADKKPRRGTATVTSPKLVSYEMS